jgi:hypothetical protein
MFPCGAREPAREFVVSFGVHPLPSEDRRTPGESLDMQGLHSKTRLRSIKGDDRASALMRDEMDSCEGRYIAPYPQNERPNARFCLPNRALTFPQHLALTAMP